MLQKSNVCKDLTAEHAVFHGLQYFVTKFYATLKWYAADKL